MKTRAVQILLLVGILYCHFVLSKANAAPTEASTCSLEFTAAGRDIQFLAGYSRLKGSGRITCVDTRRRTETLPVRVVIGTPLIFPRIAFAPTLSVEGRAVDIQILKGGPRVLLDDYLTVNAVGAIGEAGASQSLDLQGEDNGITINLKLENVEGFGIAVGATKVTLTR